MNHHHVKYLLAGGGAASSAAAVAIRKLDSTNTLLMVGQESNRPYHRPPLSKDYLLRRTQHENLFTLSDRWFADNHVTLMTGRRVEKVDTARRTVILGNAEEISYDKLLLAIGASSRRLDFAGANLPNLFYLRNFDDVGRLRHAIDTARQAAKPKAVVIGGGVLGVELAGTLSQSGLSVELVVGRPFPWHRFAGESAGKFVGRYLESHNVTVHNGRRAIRLEGDGRVQRVIMDDETPITCDFAVAAVGSVVNRELLRGTSIEAEKAILVDSHCRSSDASVYAAGDCAAVFDPLFGKHRIIDHADNAQLTGTLAGTNMAGGDATYNAVNTFSTSVLDLKATVWGEPRLVERRIVRGVAAGDAASFIEIGIAADGRIAQTLAIGDGHDTQSLKDLVAQRFAVNGNQEQLKDAAIPLKSFLTNDIS
jgi:3-phenylpropionate/trans-cinnamate dioxygenase ferredoxin reductase component